MPAVSSNQRRAMWAAAMGRGKLGIPEKVAKEYTEADPGGKLPAKAKDMARSKWDTLKRLFVEWVNEEEQEAEHAQDELATAPNGGIPTAASVLFGTPAGRVLFVKRSKTEENWPDTWSLPGGRADDGEDAATCAAREAKEEVGRDCAVDGLKEIERKKTDHGWQHVLYAHAVDEEFEPTLNDEHSEYAWRDINDPPLPLHPGVKASLEKLKAGAEDDAEQEETPDAEDEVKPAVTAKDTALLGPYPVRVQRDGAWAYDAVLLTTAARRARLTGRGDLARRAEAIRAREFGGANDAFAFDRDSVRRSDEDGRMHVSDATISRSTVDEYLGREINDVMRDKPGWKMLEDGKRYKLLRDPEEMKKAVSSFDNLPILDSHVPVSAEDHKPEHVIGSTGTDARMEGDALKNSLVFWAKSAIDGIESGNKKSLSCAYRYRADMTPGVTKDGEHFAGVMRDIVGNHLAHVDRGRVSGAVVGDAAVIIDPDRGWLVLERALRRA